MEAKKLVLFVIVFFSIFKLQIGVFDFTLISLLLAFLFLIRYRGNLRINKNFAIILASLSLVLLYTLFITIILDSNNYFFVLKYIRTIVSSISTFIIFYYLSKKNSFRVIIETVGQVLVLNVTIMWLQVFSPSFKEMLQRYLFGEGRHNWYRVTGLLNGTSSAGIFLGLASLVILYVYLVTKKKKYLVAYILSFPLYPLSAVTGLIISIIGSIILLYKCGLIRATLIIKISIFCFIFSTIFVYTFYADIPFFDKYGITTAQKRIMLLFDDNITVDHGNILVSTRALSNTYNLPPYNMQMLIGNIQPSKSEFATTTSDAGIIVNLHAYGILGLILLLGTLAIHPILAKHPLVTALTLCYVILFFKNDLLYGRIIYDLYLSIFLIVVLSKKSKCNEYKLLD